MKKFSVGKTFYALMFFALLNLWLYYCHPLAQAPTAGREWGEAYNAMKYAEEDLKENQNMPYVLLAGSSLMVAPVVQAECQYLNLPIQRFRHRRSKFCEELLKAKSSLASPSLASPLVYNLAIGGATPSDMFLVTRKFFDDNRKPAVIVYGIAPRDFQDNLIPGAQTTETFENLGTIADLCELKDHKWISTSAFNEAVAEKLSPFWKDRQDVRSVVLFYTKCILENAILWAGKITNRTLVMGTDIIKQFPEKAADSPVAKPGESIELSSKLETSERYKLSYRPLNRVMMNTQLHYFERLLDEARQKKTSVVIVNMPLSTENRKLLPSGFYEAYLASVYEVSKEKGAHFIDFNKTPWDDEKNFADTVHLTPKVSAQFLSELLSSYKKQPSQISNISFRKSGQQ